MTDKTTRAILITPSIVDDFKDNDGLALFIFILCKVNVTKEPYLYRIDGKQTVTLKQGQMFLNLKSWAARTGVSYKVARARLKTISEGNSEGNRLVTTPVTKKGIIVTVVNLDKYQTFGNYKSVQGNSEGNSQGNALGNSEGNPYHSDTNHSDNNHPEKPAAKKPPLWSVEIAKRIKTHVAEKFNKAITDKQLNKWALDIDRLTRSTKFVTKPTERQVFEIITWGLSDTEQVGNWTGWALQIQGPPSPDKFMKIQASMKMASKTKQEATPKGWSSA